MVDDAEAQARVSDDPLALLQVILGHSDARRVDGDWFELFGLEQPPADAAVLKAAWRDWCVRNHPDRGGSAVTFRRMETLYSRELARLEARR